MRQLSSCRKSMEVSPSARLGAPTEILSNEARTGLVVPLTTSNTLPAWMRSPSGYLVLNGRPSYQGKKQQAALAAVRQHRTAVDVGTHRLREPNPRQPSNRCTPSNRSRRTVRFARNVEAANVTRCTLARWAGRKAASASTQRRPAPVTPWVKGGGNIPMAGRSTARN